MGSSAGSRTTPTAPPPWRPAPSRRANAAPSRSRRSSASAAARPASSRSSAAGPARWSRPSCGRWRATGACARSVCSPGCSGSSPEGAAAAPPPHDATGRAPPKIGVRSWGAPRCSARAAGGGSSPGAVEPAADDEVQGAAMNGFTKGIGKAMTARRAALGALALPAAGLLAAGCGGSTVDNEQMEQDIAGQMSAQAGVDAAQVAVACPSDEKAEDGNEFDCRLTAPNGDEVTVNVTLTDGGDSFEAVVPPQQFD
ncbi:MAG: DUF4333 domain-containing protein [Solirubrobacterales bacterium]|nr:DUF4333 domain-containing protein [Solirubrobacterales bacterium]